MGDHLENVSKQLLQKKILRNILKNFHSKIAFDFILPKCRLKNWTD